MRDPIVKRLASWKVRKPGVVRDEARRAGLQLNHALAMLEKEAGIPQRNIFGCDYGPGLLYCHAKVTKARVKALIASGRAQGVGWTQLTYQAFVQAAQDMGGAWKPRFQMREGFKILAGLLNAYGEEAGAARYNGTGPGADAYGRDFAIKSSAWRRRGF